MVIAQIEKCEKPCSKQYSCFLKISLKLELFRFAPAEN